MSVGNATGGQPRNLILATRSVLYVMAAIMAVAAITAFVGLRRGVQEELDTTEPDPQMEAAIQHD